MCPFLRHVNWWTPTFTPRVQNDITGPNKSAFLLYEGKARMGSQAKCTDWSSR